MRFALLIAAFLLWGYAWSQPPIPSKSVQREAPERDSKANDSATSEKESASKHGIVINLAPSQQVNVPTQPKTEQHEKETVPDWWLIVPTWLLAVFTALLFFFTAR